MNKKTLYVKNMVCPRCIEAVTEVLRKEGFTIKKVRLGEAEIENFEEKKLPSLALHLQQRGFSLIIDSEKQVVEKIKTTIIELIHHSEKNRAITHSEYLSKKLGRSYPSLSKMFSRHESVTIEKYIILQKVEKVKELLSYNELSVKEIAYHLGYSSPQHLSNQFKSITGLSIRTFKKNANDHRQTIENPTGE